MQDRLSTLGETNSHFRRPLVGYDRGFEQKSWYPWSMVLGTAYNAENTGRWSQEPWGRWYGVLRRFQCVPTVVARPWHRHPTTPVRAGLPGWEHSVPTVMTVRCFDARSRQKCSLALCSHPGFYNPHEARRGKEPDCQPWRLPVRW